MGHNGTVCRAEADGADVDAQTAVLFQGRVELRHVAPEKQEAAAQVGGGTVGQKDDFGVGAAVPHAVLVVVQNLKDRSKDRSSAVAGDRNGIITRIKRSHLADHPRSIRKGVDHVGKVRLFRFHDLRNRLIAKAGGVIRTHGTGLVKDENITCGRDFLTLRRQLIEKL